uniref:Uncharacterized protein n=1 Tax=Globodera rostochiensis TaxID=31243 RepID=A0A914H6C9_GLORO
MFNFQADFWPYLVLMFNVVESKNRPMASKLPDKDERILNGKFHPQGKKCRRGEVEEHLLTLREKGHEAND